MLRRSQRQRKKSSNEVHDAIPIATKSHKKYKEKEKITVAAEIKESSDEKNWSQPTTMIRYKARPSRLELDKLYSEKHEFRGFIILFWLFMGIYFIETLLQSIAKGNNVFGMQTVGKMFLGIDDVAVLYACICLFSYVALANQVLYFRGYIGRLISGILRHFSQGLMIIVTAFIVYHHPEWRWTQRALLVCHSLLVYMKMHSFSANNELMHDLWLKGSLEMYPGNLTVTNFTKFLLTPTLVYQTDYPRTDSIRFGFLLQKALGAFGIITVVHVTMEHYVHPVLMTDIQMLETISRLLMPFIVINILIFFLIFECVCNFLAEITMFADRNFYDDWWNSTSFEEFARKWNKPVHHFLLRHVYAESVMNFKLSKPTASAVTFLFSSLLHELTMGLMARRFRFYFFGLQMMQVPLIWISRISWIKHRQLLGNVFFWFSLSLGPPLLAVMYTWEYFKK